MSYVIKIFILCKVLMLVCSEDIFCDYGVARDENVDVFVRNDMYLGESRDTIRNCLCSPTKCVYKCCPLDEEISNMTCQTSAVAHIIGLKEYVKGYLTLPEFDIIHHPIECFDPGMTRFIINPRNSYKAPATNFIVTPDIDGMEEELQYFCVDFHREYHGYVGIICLQEILDISVYGNTTGMIISMPFLLATFLVYALLPDRNLPAKALMCYVLSLLFAYILLVTIQLNAGHKATTCISLAFFCYYFFMASFFWMNSSCLDIFFTFSGIRGLLGDKKKEHKRFAYYSAYAWGVPLLMVGFASIFTFAYTDANNSFYTGLGQGQCWFRNGWATGIYFYFPIAILLIVNMVLFGVTTYKIKRVQKDTKMLKNVDSRKHKYDNNDKQRYDTDSDLVYLTDIELRENHQSDTLNMYDFLEEDSKCFSFNLYVKLLFAMGINWSMEVISWAIMWKWSNVPDYVWVLTDFCNAVYGVFIFFIFVFKRNIWMLLKKRYLQLTGRPQQAHNLTSTHRTTVSQVSSSEA